MGLRYGYGALGLVVYEKNRCGIMHREGMWAKHRHMLCGNAQINRTDKKENTENIWHSLCFC